jgi:hypothetical protein
MVHVSLRCLVGLPALAVVTILICDVGPVHAQVKKSDSVVKVEAKADNKPGADGKQTITITIDIDKDWHIYANPVKNEDLVNAQTTVTIASRVKLEDVKIDYPPGKPYGQGDERHEIYEGKATIKASVKRARGDHGPLEVTVKLQSCSKSTCLFPATIKKEVR